MKFLRVKPEYDNVRLGNDDIYIGGELYTPYAAEKLGLNRAYLEEVDIPKEKTFISFGARFEFEV